MIRNTNVAIWKSEAESYPPAPFSPAKLYPEYRYGDLAQEGAIYEAVRETFKLLGLDAQNYNTAAWNPLGELITPGNKVVIKPNLVLDFNESGESTDCMITHASVLRPIIDFVLIALKGDGQVIVADSPHGNADFERIKAITGLNELQEYYKQHNIKIEVLDVRKYEYGHGTEGFFERRKTVNRDPDGYVEINLGVDSAFADLQHIENIYGADFDRSEIRKYHTSTTNKYLVAKTFLNADVIINVPKLKTHKKIGTTLNLKSLIGINGDKNYLPHFRIGDASHGGDEFPQLASRREWWKRRLKNALEEKLLGNNKHKKAGLYKALHFLYSEVKGQASTPAIKESKIGAGNWHGNDTVYRTVYDLSQILFLADKNGIMRKTPQRRFFSIIDGIIAGEKEGPLKPSPKPCGVIIGGFDPVAVDMTATRLMGFNTDRMVVFSRLSTLPASHPLQPIDTNNIKIVSNYESWNKNIFESNDRHLAFVPHHGWGNYLEIF